MLLKRLQLTLEQIQARLAPFGRKIINEWSFTLSAVIAFNLLTTIIPLGICILSVISLIFGDSVAAQAIGRDRLNTAFSEENVTGMIDDVFASQVNKSGTLLGISLIIALFTSSRLLICFDDIFTIIYRVRERTVKQQNIHALKMLLIFLLLVSIILIASISVSLFTAETNVGYYILAVVISVIVTFILFYSIYYFMPPRKMSCKNIWCGTVFLTISWQILLQLFPLYVRHFMTNYIGQIGFILIVLVACYIYGLLFIIGAQINAHFFEHIPPLPQGLGNCLSQFANPEGIQLIDKPSHSYDSASTLISGLQPVY